MDPVLHYKIYREGVDEQAISKYAKYAKPRYFYDSVTDYIWEN